MRVAREEGVLSALSFFFPERGGLVWAILKKGIVS